MRAAAGLAAAILLACPAPAAEFDLARYMGSWYEIAHIPNHPQKGCADTVVHYRADGSGGFELVNACWKGDRYKPYRGRATPAGESGLFRVKFFLFFGADYWIVDVDPDYRWALVGTPDLGRLWVISREPSLDPALYEEILGRARSKGFDTSRLARTPITGRPSRGFDD